MKAPGAVRSSQQDRIGSDRGVPWRLPGALQSACPAATECRGWHLPALSHGLWSSAPGSGIAARGLMRKTFPPGAQGSHGRLSREGGTVESLLLKGFSRIYSLDSCLQLLRGDTAGIRGVLLTGWAVTAPLQLLLSSAGYSSPVPSMEFQWL